MKTNHLFYSLLLAALWLNTTAQIVFVDAGNTTGTENGTLAYPFNTIREGINAAVPGDQVRIMPGTYIPDESWSGNDHTLFLKAGVSLVGESRDSTIIAGIIVDQQASNLSIALEKLKFDEFHFIRGTIAGPFPGINSIRDCATTLISLSFGAGIPVNDTTPGPNYEFQIENNDLGNDGIIEFKQGAGVSELNVMGNSCGYIYLKSGGGYSYLIDNNDVRYGVFDKSGANTTTISNNRIFNGLIDDSSGGNQYGLEDEIIENNIINADESSPAFIDEDYKTGIMVKSRSATIRNNTITVTGHVSGIRSSAGAPLHIINNTITLDEVQTPDPDPPEGTLGIFNYSGWGNITGNTIFGGDHGYYSKAGTAEFAYNVIGHSFTGFYSVGAETVHHNIITNCKGDGMILDGLRGPLHHNEIKNNTGAGIRITRVPIDLGGGADNSPGKNTIQGNGNYDIYIETSNTQNPTVFARYNIWDHEIGNEIAQLDIRDGNDSTGLVTVDFSNFGGLGLNEISGNLGLNTYPNPLSTTTVIKWHSATSGHVVLTVFDCTGTEVKTLVDDDMPCGEHQVLFETTNLPAGVYFYQLQANGMIETKKMVVYK
jgi:hypothetical protein